MFMEGHEKIYMESIRLLGMEKGGRGGKGFAVSWVNREIILAIYLLFPLHCICVETGLPEL